MYAVPRMDSDALVAISHAIDAAMDRGDMDEAIRLSSMQGPELSRWLKAHGFPCADAGETLPPVVARRDHDDVTAAEGGSPQRDPVGVDSGLGPGEGDRGAVVS
jgi:hypothetical protein